VPAGADWAKDVYEAPCLSLHCTDTQGPDSCVCLDPAAGPRSFGVRAPLVPESMLPTRRLMTSGEDVTEECALNVSFSMTIDTGRTDLDPDLYFADCDVAWTATFFQGEPAEGTDTIQFSFTPEWDIHPHLYGSTGTITATISSHDSEGNPIGGCLGAVDQTTWRTISWQGGASACDFDAYCAGGARLPPHSGYSAYFKCLHNEIISYHSSPTMLELTRTQVCMMDTSAEDNFQCPTPLP